MSFDKLNFQGQGAGSRIEVVELSASYGNAEVFKNLNFTLEPGIFTALCGKNGAGKSTLLSLMDGIIPDGLKVAGDILVNGKSVFTLKRDQIAKEISYLVQKETPVWNMNVRDFIETGLYSFRGMSKGECDRAVEACANSLYITELLDKNVYNISGGEFQKCRLARSLVQNAGVLLFDEPSENLDLPFQVKFLEQIKESQKNKTVLFSIHDVNTAALSADEMILFCGEKLIKGSFEKVFTEENLSCAYGTKCRIYEHPVTGKKQVMF